MEAIRKKAGVTRSAFILGIFREWRAARLRENAVKSYIAGYRERPEDPTFAEAMARAAAEILSDEDWS
ncbi:MAG: hypothetical protein NTZ26_04220 [Candidatus Aminicenantes bacterium]|nr:hypothetical protein [Candidatus Aminicenantes bacterium]